MHLLRHPQPVAGHAPFADAPPCRALPRSAGGDAPELDQRLVHMAAAGQQTRKSRSPARTTRTSPPTTDHGAHWPRRRRPQGQPQRQRPAAQPWAAASATESGGSFPIPDSAMRHFHAAHLPTMYTTVNTTIQTRIDEMPIPRRPTRWRRRFSARHLPAAKRGPHDQHRDHAAVTCRPWKPTSV